MIRYLNQVRHIILSDGVWVKVPGGSRWLVWGTRLWWSDFRGCYVARDPSGEYFSCVCVGKHLVEGKIAGTYTTEPTNFLDASYVYAPYIPVEV